MSLNQLKQRLLSGNQRFRTSPLYPLENLLVSLLQLILLLASLHFWVCDDVWVMFLSEPRFLIDYIQNLKSSERSLKEQVWHWSTKCFMYQYQGLEFVNTVWWLLFPFQLEIAKRKEASCIVQYAKREQEMAELKVVSQGIQFIAYCPHVFLTIYI